MFAPVSHTKVVLYFTIATANPCRAPHVGGGNVERARELEQRSAYLESQMTREPRIIPGLNPSSSSSPSSASSSSCSDRSPSRTQNVTAQMAGMSMDSQVHTCVLYHV